MRPSELFVALIYDLVPILLRHYAICERTSLRYLVVRKNEKLKETSTHLRSSTFGFEDLLKDDRERIEREKKRERIL